MIARTKCASDATENQAAPASGSSRIPDFACANKARYGTWSAAKRDAWHLRSKTGKIVAPYRCHGCGAYHLGSVKKYWFKRCPVRPPSRKRLRQGMARLYQLLPAPTVISG